MNRPDHPARGQLEIREGIDRSRGIKKKRPLPHEHEVLLVAHRIANEFAVRLLNR